MLELPEPLRDAIAKSAGQPLTLTDPRTGQTYVLLRRGVLQQILDSLPEPDDFEGIDVATLMDEAMREEDADDPMLENHPRPRDAS